MESTQFDGIVSRTKFRRQFVWTFEVISEWCRLCQWLLSDKVIIEKNCDWEVALRLCFSKIKRFWNLYWIEMTSSLDMSSEDWGVSTKSWQCFEFKGDCHEYFFDFWMRSVEGQVEQFRDTLDFTHHHNVDDGYDDWTCVDWEYLKVVNDCQFFQLKKRFSEFPVACKTQKQMGF